MAPTCASLTPPFPDPGSLESIAAALGREYVPEAQEPSGEPLDELVATILSQHTSDANSKRAFEALKARFPRWSMALAADASAIADAIRSGGLAQQKAPWVLGLLEALPRDACGEPTLDYLAGMGAREAYEHLQAFAGVGPKTAACTLLFAYGWPVFPVDVHVHRVARRLGWAGGNEPADKVQDRLVQAVPAQHVYRLHMGMVRHGRRACRPHRPACEGCVIRSQCARCGLITVSASAGDCTAGRELPVKPLKPR